jgi:hypothetical protein
MVLSLFGLLALAAGWHLCRWRSFRSDETIDTMGTESAGLARRWFLFAALAELAVATTVLVYYGSGGFVYNEEHEDRFTGARVGIRIVAGPWVFFQPVWLACTPGVRYKIEVMEASWRSAIGTESIEVCPSDGLLWHAPRKRFVDMGGQVRIEWSAQERIPALR